jgi:hypothetical protein
MSYLNVEIRGKIFIAKCGGQLTHPQMIGRLVALYTADTKQVWPKK